MDSAAKPRPPGQDRPLSVADLSRRIQRLLEGEVGEIWVEGEISNLRIPASGHCYFVLKDSEAAINAVCFRSTLARQRLRPTDGMKLEVRGRVTAYVARSEYQIIVEQMREAGLGDLMRRFLELKEKLTAEGLFDDSRKRPFPVMPRRIGIVTSSTGAALRDMLNILGRRARGLEIFLAPAAVQGEQAPAEIVAALKRLARQGKAEVLIVGRGGGSIEDLWAFNDERVVRAIAASPIPVISAVGHQTDWTLSDFAADLRAPTPSAAAELVTAHHGEMADRLAQQTRRLGRAIGQTLTDRRARLERAQTSWGLRRPVQQLQMCLQRLDDLESRIERVNPLRRMAILRQRLERAEALLRATGPARWAPRIQSAQSSVDQLLRRMTLAMQVSLSRRSIRVESAQQRLASVSPDAVLKRGYSIVTHGARGRIVTRPEQVRTGETVRIQSAGGQWRAAALPPGEDLFDAAES